MKNIVARMNRAPGDQYLAHVLISVVDGWSDDRRRHIGAWLAPKGFDRAFKRCVEAIVTTSDACGGPQNDYLLRPHIVDMYAAARQLLNYLEHLDGGSCDDLLRQLAQADGFNPDNVS